MEDTYYLQDEYLEPDSDDDFAYEEVDVDDAVISSGDEDLSTALQNQALTSTTDARQPLLANGHTAHKDTRPEVVEDFVRNFLVSNGMLSTAECFQTEWYQLVQTGRLPNHKTQQLPDIYTQNRQLEAMLEEMTKQLNTYKETARLSKEKYVRVQKERDYHRMHHRRVVQEKERLRTDIKRMKDHFSSYEPLLDHLKQKYQAVTKEKMLACLERDRAQSEVGCLQSTLQSVQQASGTGSAPKHVVSAAPMQRQITNIETTQKASTKMKVCEFPLEPSNPSHQLSQLPVCTHLTRTGGFQAVSNTRCHDYAINSVAVHPSKAVIATASDDHTWKMWAVPSGELLLSGEGHGDWLSDIEFHPRSPQLATSAGDGSLKVWDFDKGCCVSTFTDHQQPVWSISWHWDGVYLASSGMDHTAKLWDTNRSVCVSTLRGHADSVNTVHFMPYANTLWTCSADKTISLWDCRTGLCVQTYYGHQHSVNDIKPSPQGWSLYSCDCFGSVREWDVRSHISGRSWDMGPNAVNKLALDPAAALVAVARANNHLTMLDTAADKEWSLEAGSGVLNTLDVVFTQQADSLLSADNSGHVTLWK